MLSPLALKSLVGCVGLEVPYGREPRKGFWFTVSGPPAGPADRGRSLTTPPYRGEREGPILEGSASGNRRISCMVTGDTPMPEDSGLGRERRWSRFRNRQEAGQRLGAALAPYAGRSDLLVLALPRGGVPVAFEVAALLQAPLDVFVVRKLGVPGQQELAMGAIASGGVQVINREVVESLGIPLHVIEAVAEEERRELARREEAYRGDRPPPRVDGRSVILVDDGLATGSTMRAAVNALRKRKPAGIVVAVPVSAPETWSAIRGLVDDGVCLATPEAFFGVGMWYEDFSQTSDEEVNHLLAIAPTPASEARE